MGDPYRITFVCTGNICRSPMAEWVFRRHVEDEGLDGAVEVDSSGTEGWHRGKPADPRTDATLVKFGYETGHAARPFDARWFPAYDLVIALDEDHFRELRRRAPDEASRAKVRLLREFDPDAEAGDLDVPDPYYGGIDGFEDVLAMIEAATPGMLAEVRRGLDARA
ncbi:low molecular weight protein-tyrosine-phosphatase [Yinghuangia seranimata]|uniref:low molecular weight protein-tyrosine-phosphatase n=1 Tax=Yinghuangia seranimata TaxID=408067 RepID=UPI00248CB95C|nr:low molecular weight protein-tyrosine-phosphatase [Yinghuangia seranimata]MDI2127255.1 low molecular weight protein-tyrosine-phosphatase [Yinghuangia seranimata]MDI2132200.1 low molecular weight protein-tyrosine-phosphatase [Yinghuangia seranimata]